MIRLIITFVLIALLLIAATFEHNFIQGAYNKLEEDMNALSAIVYSQEKIDTEENIAKSESMYKYWIKKEKKLAMLTRHADLSFISDSLIYIKNFIRFDNKEEACVGFEKLRYLIDIHCYNVSASIQNVI